MTQVFSMNKCPGGDVAYTDIDFLALKRKHH
jgi:hypothetical protein